MARGGVENRLNRGRGIMLTEPAQGKWQGECCSRRVVGENHGAEWWGEASGGGGSVASARGVIRRLPHLLVLPRITIIIILLVVGRH